MNNDFFTPSTKINPKVNSFKHFVQIWCVRADILYAGKNYAIYHFTCHVQGAEMK